MSPERWDRVKDVVAEAMERKREERDTFLNSACGDDHALRAEVESLLAREVEASRLLTVPDSDRLGSVLRAHHADLAVGRTIGWYKIKAVLGYGGMGVVYRAAQDHPHREVALKVMSGGLHVTPYQLRLFRREVESLARLHHSGIAALYEAGQDDDGRQYFAMELVDGRPLTEYASSTHSAIADRLRIFVRICRAIQYAHQRGVIHRDIKPSNIVVGDDAQPKVLDFGLAKLMEDVEGGSVTTSIGKVHGTLSYMSPEQAGGGSSEIDVRSDVYSLGVVLFELLTDRRPYEVTHVALPRAIETICHEPAPRAGSIVPSLRGDLELILDKALAKEPERRYQSADALADDIERFLSNQPISARRPSAVYHLRKLAVRHKVPAALTLLLFLAVTALAVVATTMSLRLAEQRNVAIAARDDAEAVTTFLTDTVAAANPSAMGKDVSVRRVMDEAAATVAERFADRPLIEARVRRTLGWTYRGLGLFLEAERHLEEAASIYTRVLGPDDPRTLGARNAHATLVVELGKFTSGEIDHRKTLELQRRVLGEEHPETLASLNNLATSLARQGRYAEAEAMSSEALEVFRRVLGEQHPRTMSVLDTLANCVGLQGRYAESEALRRQTLEIRRRFLGEKHPLTLRARMNLATTIELQGRHAEAEAMHREVLELKRQILGPEHPGTLDSLGNLASSVGAQGRYDEAEALRRQVLDIRRRVLGEEHPRTLLGMMNLAICLTNQERYAEAEVLHRQALEGQRRILGPEHPQTLASMASLANCAGSQGRHAEADALRRETLEMRRRVLGEEHPYTLVTMMNLARGLDQQGRRADAEALYRETLELQRRVVGAEHPQTVLSMTYLAESLFEQQRYAEAEALLLESYRILTSSQTSDANLAHDVADALVRLYQAWSRLAEAERWRTRITDAHKPL